MKDSLTKDEYQQTLEKLDYIAKEKELLKELNLTINYKSHLQLSSTFQELIININRENNILDEKIKIEQKFFLEEYKPIKKLYYYLKEKTDFLILLLENKEQKEQNELLPLLTPYTGFEIFYPKIIDLTSQKIANTYLLDYIKNLDKEENNLLIKKNSYEKQKKKLIN